MNNLIRFAVAGALTVGYSTATLAQALPSSNNADLWLFVADPTTQTTFSEDTGISISSLMPSGSFSSGASLSTAISDNINLLPTSALATYIATNGASNLEWAVQGVQYNTVTFSGAKKAGGAIGITGNAGVPSLTSQLQLANLESWGGGLNQDVGYIDNGSLAGNYVAGGKSYAWSYGSATGNVWGQGAGNIAGSTDLYGNGADTAGRALGSSVTLYGVTGNGGTGTLQSYILGTLELDSVGNLTTLGSSPVPLPAAVWLFGSGLLGLAGVGRRRSVTAAT
jgi:hypothetical protein